MRKLGEIDDFGDPDIGGRIILRWVFKKWDMGGGEYGLYPAGPGWGRWRSFVNAVMKLRFPCGEFF